jgi:hypothetical protein
MILVAASYDVHRHRNLVPASSFHPGRILVIEALNNRVKGFDRKGRSFRPIPSSHPLCPFVGRAPADHHDEY